jgi:hypothetical protein
MRMRQYSRVGECVEFNGVRFYRYPESAQRAHRTYFTPGIADRKRGVKALHQEVWTAAHGPIPDGHVVHHADGDSTNNVEANLVCVDRRQHAADHLSERSRTPEHLAHLDAIRPLAYEWRRSPEGRQTMADRSRSQWAEKQPVTKTCAHCGSSYECMHDFAAARYCSSRCAQAAIVQEGRYAVERTCVVCGQDFTTNRHRKTQSCSPACAGRLISATRIRLFEQGEITPNRRRTSAA